jgi:hypothetical protein
MALRSERSRPFRSPVPVRHLMASQWVAGTALLARRAGLIALASVAVATTVAGCAVDPKAAEMRRMCRELPGQMDDAIAERAISWTQYAQLAQIHAVQCTDRSPAIELLNSYLFLLARQVDSGRISHEEASLRYNMFGQQVVANAFQAKQQYEIGLRQIELQERSVRASEEIARQMQAPRTAYCTGQSETSPYARKFSMVCN